jgi:hypothetical protein
LGHSFNKENSDNLVLVHLLVEIINCTKMHGEYKVKDLLNYAFSYANPCVERNNYLDIQEFLRFCVEFEDLVSCSKDDARIRLFV